MTQTREWTGADVEQVCCCVCGQPGRPVYRLPPFGVVRCPSCQLVFVNPRLTSAALQRVYDDVGYFEGGVYGDSQPAAGGWSWSPAMALQRIWTAGRLNLVRDALGRAERGTRLLEVGCGYGLFLASARERGHDVTGVELSQPAARHARDALGLTVHQGQLTETRLEGPFDVIVAWDTLEHVPDPVQFLRAARALLADDGVLAFSTPYFSSLPARLLRTRWWTLKPVEHIWQFTPQTHSIVCARAGLALTRVLRSPLAPANFARLDSLVGVAHRLPDRRSAPT